MEKKVMKKKESSSDIFPLTMEKVAQLVSLAKDSQLAELTLTNDDKAVTIRLGGAPVMPAARQEVRVEHREVERDEAKTVSTPPRGKVIKAPMVGTAYMSSSPGAAPFIKAGDRVETGQTLLIIEAMKVMNQITAPSSGVIKDILVNDKDPVEFDQELIVYV